ncbi:hypothetical protein [Streptomyces sp. H34-S4]|uniref:hypothetical protein n=1 Tax=Streptomyces sp. H34-S4 TaxID=2996463 RepID=UPI002271FBD2|nr:hypothetical protein [Streptomyces sp. H34-S4]MCY0939418.1 hypothetical protein [Streptomyces sp. H34-S4]
MHLPLDDATGDSAVIEFLDRLPPADTPARAYAALLSVMRDAAQSFGTPDPARPNISMIIWRTLADLTHRVYAFESSFSPDIVWTRLDHADFDRAARLDPTADNLVGDVTDATSPANRSPSSLRGREAARSS